VKEPNFFIVGAPRCGTTALFTQLGSHPQIFLNPRRKEVHYFGTDLHRHGGRRFTEEEYLGFFAGATDELRVGEASTSYFYSKRAASEIKQFNPAAKIIIMLRDPVEMMYSLHTLFVFHGEEPLTDFAAALHAEEQRKRGLCLPDGPYLLEALLYREIARFSQHVSRYFDVFGRENVHIIIFDDFVSETPRIYSKTLRFLDVNTDFQPHFKIVNLNRSARIKRLNDLLRHPPLIAQAVSHILLPERLRELSRGLLVRLNTSHRPRPPIDPGLRRQLQHDLLPEVEQLSALLGRDLTRWCKDQQDDQVRSTIRPTKRAE